MNKLDMKSIDIVQGNINKIRELFPNVVVESERGYSIDFDMLKQELSEDIIDGPKEKYQLTWPGKKASIIKSNEITKDTLRPVVSKSFEFDKSSNIYIEGDNLDTLKLLQQSYLNKIKCIYIDPPYNTGSDFIYNDKFVKSNNEELERSGDVDEQGNILITNSSSNGRYHSDWLSMMYPRLKLARNLLKKDGICYISIDEHEIHNLIKLVTEIFGDNNYEVLIWRKNGKQGNTKIVNRFKTSHEYIVVAYKNKAITSLGKMKLMPNWQNEYPNPDNDPRGNYKAGNISKMEEKSRPNSPNYYSITTPSGRVYTREWFISKEEFERLDEDKVETEDGRFVGRIYYPNNGDGVPALKIFKDEEQYYYFDSIIDEMGTFTDAHKKLIGLFDGKDLFDTPKPVKMIKEFVRICTEENDIVLDFFGGSSTTAHSVMELNAEDGKNRKYIIVQIPEKCDEKSVAYQSGYRNICEIGQERIRRAAKIIKEETSADIDYGFKVYKVDSSNMKDVYYKPNEISQKNLFDYMINIKEDRTAEDLLTQVMLDLGLTLDLKIEKITILNNSFYFVAENVLVACFDDNIDINIINEICKYNPMKVVFRDTSFKTDADKINLEERIKKLSPETEISIL